MRILVTGATGFVGKHLLPALQQRWPEAVIEGWGSNLPLADAVAVEAIVARFKPTHVVHLAGQASVPASFAEPLATYSTNVMGTANLLQAVYSQTPGALVLAVGSADPYGASFQAPEAVSETTVLAPLNPYAASKAAAEVIAQEYARRGLQLLCLRPFNHTGPGQSDDYVVSAFAHQVARIQQGLQTAQIQVGNLDAERDFSDVRDIVAGYIHLLDIGHTLPSGCTLNLGSGVPRSIASVLNALIAQTGVSVDIVQDPARMRPSDIPRVVADTRRINALGWHCTISWEHTLNDMLAWWAEQERES